MIAHSSNKHSGPPWKLGILDCDIILPHLRIDFANYGEAFVNYFEHHCPGVFNYEIYHLKEGDHLPHINSCDAFLITGSKSSANDNDDWIISLSQFILECNETSKPMIGICFGHQLIAKVLGGTVQKHDAGWGVGVATSSVVEHYPWMIPQMNEVNLLVSHQDQVSLLPPDATQILTNEFCLNAGFCIPSRALCFQGHPEFTIPYSKVLMIHRINDIGETTFDVALNSLEKELDADIVALWTIQFLKAYCNAQNR